MKRVRKNRQVAGTRRLPLLLGPGQISALVVEIAEPLLEARFRLSTYKVVDESRPQIAVALQQLEDREVARCQREALPRLLALHAGSALPVFHA